MVDPNKDKRHRKNRANCDEEIRKLLKEILDDSSFESWRWDNKKQSVKKARTRIRDPQFLLNQLTSIIMENMNPGHDVRKIKSALQELQSFFQQSKNLVLSQDGADGIHKLDHIPLNGNEDLQKKVEELRKEMEKPQSYGEELEQMMVRLEQTHQSIKEALACTRVTNLPYGMVDSCMKIAENNILNGYCTHQVEGHHGVEIHGEQIKPHFPQTTDSFQINEKGKNAEVHNQEGSPAADLLEEVFAGTSRCPELDLHDGFFAGTSGSPAVGLPDYLFPEDYFHLPECGGNLDGSLEKNLTATNGDGSTSTAAANEANLKLSPDETCIVQGYKVFNRNAKALAEIFQNNPNIVENFRIADQDLQSAFMNSLAEVYIKVKKGEEEMLELREIESILFKVRDMEHTGLKVAWLREMLELQTQNYKALMKKAKDPSKLGKKRRLQ